ncbi:hypothetical protein NDU88_003651 [Pleurodeles waltl]|uniref:Uncharacterized protein n=1 Tax=Pleurodeles waltl TaxID=8319 RepID=A0AAV7LHN7_PLEWA|nr:hypothetical protein NDU88_003651 [Pleurodeles waltl]
MAGYEDQANDEYYLEDSGPFEKDLVHALNAGVRHTVNQALAQAIKPIKHHLIGFAEQRGWVAPSGVQSIVEPSLSGGFRSLQQSHNPHSADFQSLIRAMAKEHDYNVSAQKTKSREDLVSSSSDHSSETGDDPLHKRKKKSHHQEDPLPTPKVLTFEPEDIVHPRSSLWVPPAEVSDYVESHIRHSFDKEVRSRLRSECPRVDFSSKPQKTNSWDTYPVRCSTFHMVGDSPVFQVGRFSPLQDVLRIHVLGLALTYFVAILLKQRKRSRFV